MFCKSLLLNCRVHITCRNMHTGHKATISKASKVSRAQHFCACGRYAKWHKMTLCDFTATNYCKLLETIGITPSPTKELKGIVTRALRKTAPTAMQQGRAVVPHAWVGKQAYLMGSKHLPHMRMKPPLPPAAPRRERSARELACQLPLVLLLEKYNVTKHRGTHMMVHGHESY